MLATSLPRIDLRGIWIPETECETPFCRICLDSDIPSDLFSPCKCKGSSLRVHRQCLATWLRVAKKGALDSGSKCQSCHFVYVWDVSRVGRIVQNYANQISVMVVLVVFLCTGIVWHLLDPVHQWFGETQYDEMAAILSNTSSLNLASSSNLSSSNETSFSHAVASAGLFADTLWGPANATYITSGLSNSLCYNSSSFKLLCDFQSAPLLASHLLTALAFILEGWMLTVLFHKSDGYSFRPVSFHDPLHTLLPFIASHLRATYAQIFLTIHVLAYIVTGALYPFQLFEYASVAASALVDLAAGIAARVGGHVLGSVARWIEIARMVSFEGGVAGAKDWMEMLVLTVSRFSVVEDVFLRRGQPESELPRVALLVLRAFVIMAKFCSTFYIAMLECYYCLMLAACMYDSFNQMFERIKKAILDQVQGAIVEYEVAQRKGLVKETEEPEQDTTKR
ncbi:hypothetical protein BC830DRAFT_1171811 [Chytriomyces sp. MP71]|nr:hypothetical protein BC830DRAFT_1171811 [Chytriomyces sp. MP71]